MRQPEPYRPGPEDERTWSIPLATAVLWDYSDLPVLNQPLKKLGAKMAMRGAAVEAWGDDPKLPKIADGSKRNEDTSAGKRTPTLYNVLPDNWVLRYFQKDGKGNLSAWCPRLVVDQTNPHTSLENRGTMFVDFEGSQVWAWGNDLWRMTGISAAVADKELAFNGAAYLGMLYPDGKGGGIQARNALATEISLNLGHVATSKKVGQWAQILTFVDPPADAGPGKTKAGPGKTKGGAAGRPDKKAELALLHRTPFKLANGLKITMPPIEPAPKTVDDGDEYVDVHFSPGKPNPQKPDLEENKLSNFKPIEVANHPQLAAWTKRKRAYSPTPTGPTHYDDSYHGRPPEKPGYSAGGGGSGGSGGSGGDDDGSGDPLPWLTDYDRPGSPFYSPPDAGDGLPVENGDTKTDADGNTYHKVTWPDGTTSWDRDTAPPKAAGTKQVQQGHLKAQSPSFTQRTNSHWYDSARDVVAPHQVRKPAGWTSIILKTEFKLSRIPQAGEWVELAICMVDRNRSGDSTPTIYGYSWAFGEDCGDLESKWFLHLVKFSDLPKAEQELEVIFALMAHYPTGGDFGASTGFVALTPDGLPGQVHRSAVTPFFRDWVE
jgi:hypothetical protein